jgi:penicillin-binding protein 1A
VTKFIGKPDDQSSLASPLTPKEPAVRSEQLQDGQGEALPDSALGTEEAQPTQPRPPKPYQIAARRFGLLLFEVLGKKQIHRRFWFWFGVSASGGAIVLISAWQRLEASLPKTADALETFAREGTMTVKAADGSTIQEIGPVTHEYLDITQIPQPLQQAFIAIEDRRFEEHGGVDYWGVMRASFANLRAGDVVEGGSTITQQLARIVFLNQERHLWRKLREIRLAQRIEYQFPKEKILERYLNLVYVGSGAYGIADAAWIYFGKPVRELTTAEAATIAGIAPAPSVYSPIENKDKATERRNLVLERMAAAGFITPEEAKDAIATPIVLNPQQPKRLQRQNPYFADFIQKELPRYLSPQQLKAGGIVVETTLHPAWQRAAEEAVKKAVEEYGSYQNFKQAALVALDPRSGEIRAMVGGKDYYDKESNGQFNRATQAKRQPGSTFKTFVYSTAIAAGFSPFRGLRDEPYIVDGYTPKNYDEEYQGWVSMRDALVFSRNIPAVRALIEVGWEPTIDIAKKMGIESPLKSTYSLALGASEVNLLELVSAYGTLANQGVHWKVTGIRRILDRDGKVLYQTNVKPVKALDEDSSNIMTWMLRQVVDNGTGTPAQLDRPAAGKTGTTDDSRDLWFVGYIPQLVAGVWLGNDDNDPTLGKSGTAAAVWKQFMTEAIAWLPEQDFPDRPDQVEGRKGIIEAKPIKPKRDFFKPRPESESESDSSSDNDSSSERSSRRRRRSSQSYDSTSESSESSGSSRRSRRSRSYSSESSGNSSRRRQSYSSESESSSPPRRSRSQSSSGSSSSSPSRSNYSPPPASESAPEPAPIPEVSKPAKPSASEPSDSAAPSATE